MKPSGFVPETFSRVKVIWRAEKAVGVIFSAQLKVLQSNQANQPVMHVGPTIKGGVAHVIQKSYSFVASVRVKLWKKKKWTETCDSESVLQFAVPVGCSSCVCASMLRTLTCHSQIGNLVTKCHFFFAQRLHSDMDIWKYRISLSIKDGWGEQERHGTFFPTLTLPKRGF